MSEDKLPTASEHVSNQMANEQYDVFESHIAFAKMCVKKALEEISKEFKMDEDGEEWEDDSYNRLESIINSYPLEDIK